MSKNLSEIIFIAVIRSISGMGGNRFLMTSEGLICFWPRQKSWQTRKATGEMALAGRGILERDHIAHRCRVVIRHANTWWHGDRTITGIRLLHRRFICLGLKKRATTSWSTRRGSCLPKATIFAFNPVNHWESPVSNFSATILQPPGSAGGFDEQVKMTSKHYFGECMSRDIY
jgi:hypothetical protein